MDANRQVRIWTLLAEQARESGRRISISLVCETACRILGADGVSVSLVADGAREVACATDHLSRRLEELQYMLGQGPCLQAFDDGAPVFVSDLTLATNRWPMFGPAAMELGARALFCFPLQYGAIGIGAFEVHRTSAGPLSRDELSDALVLADTVAVLLVDALQPDISGHGAGENGAGEYESGFPFDYHDEVYQATGMLSVQLHIDLDDALARLRGYAFAHELRISAVARDILAGRLRLDEGDADE